MSFFPVNTGSGKAHAAICVNFPAGATCTCSGNGKTWAAGSPGGEWVFVVQKDGEYTVAATDGTTTKTQTVTIEGEGDFAIVGLSFWAGELFDNGEQFISATGGWDRNTSAKAYYPAGGTASVDSTINVHGIKDSYSAIVSTKNAIDFTGWSRLYYTVASIGNEVHLSISKNATIAAGEDIYTSYAARQDHTNTGTFHVDLAAIQGEHTIAIYSFHSSTSTISKVWLE